MFEMNCLNFMGNSTEDVPDILEDRELETLMMASINPLNATLFWHQQPTAYTTPKRILFCVQAKYMPTTSRI